MHPYKIEIENGIEYVVIEIMGDDYSKLNEEMNTSGKTMLWKKFVKENFKLLKNPNFKIIIGWQKIGFILYTNKYKFHNINGPATLTPKILSDGQYDGQFYIDGIKCESEEEYINELRRRILNEINNGDTIEL